MRHISGSSKVEVQAIDWLYETFKIFATSGLGKNMDSTVQSAITSGHREPVNVNFMGFDTIAHTDEGLRVPHAAGDVIVVVSIQKPGLWLFHSIETPEARRGVVAINPGDCIIMSGDVRYKFQHAVYTPNSSMVEKVPLNLEKARVSLTLRYGALNVEAAQDQKKLCATLASTDQAANKLRKIIPTEIWHALGMSNGVVARSVFCWHPISVQSRMQPSKKMITFLNVMCLWKHGEDIAGEKDILGNGKQVGINKIIADIVNQTIYFIQSTGRLRRKKQHKTWDTWLPHLQRLPSDGPLDESFYGRNLQPATLLTLQQKHVDPLKMRYGDIPFQTDFFLSIIDPIATAYAKILNLTVPTAPHIHVLPMDIGCMVTRPEWFDRSPDELLDDLNDVFTSMELLPPVLIVPTIHKDHLILLRCSQNHGTPPRGAVLELCTVNACGRDGEKTHEVLYVAGLALLGLMRLLADREQKCFVYHESQLSDTDVIPFENQWKGCSCLNSSQPLHLSALQQIQVLIDRISAADMANYTYLARTETDETIYECVIRSILNRFEHTGKEPNDLWCTVLPCIGKAVASIMDAQDQDYSIEWWTATTLHLVRCVVMAYLARESLNDIPLRIPKHKSNPLLKLRTYLQKRMRITFTKHTRLQQHRPVLNKAYTAVFTDTLPSHINWAAFKAAEHKLQVLHFALRFEMAVAVPPTTKNVIYKPEFVDILMSADNHLQVYQHAAHMATLPGQAKCNELSANAVQEYDSNWITWFLRSVADAAVANAYEFAPIQLLQRVFGVDNQISNSVVLQFSDSNMLPGHNSSNGNALQTMMIPDSAVLLPAVYTRTSLHFFTMRITHAFM